MTIGWLAFEAALETSRSCRSKESLVLYVLSHLSRIFSRQYHWQTICDKHSVTNLRTQIDQSFWQYICCWCVSKEPPQRINSRLFIIKWRHNLPILCIITVRLYKNEAPKFPFRHTCLCQWLNLKFEWCCRKATCRFHQWNNLWLKD